MSSSISPWLVALGALITCLTTGLGAIPLAFGRPSERDAARGESLAAGLMLAAAGLLLWEGAAKGLPEVAIGAAIGVAFVEVVARRLHSHEELLTVGSLSGRDARRVLLVVGVMTAHSFAEGIGIGVSYGDGQSLGVLVTVVMAIHNIPEGLAIALVLVPRGVSVLKAAWWAVFSSIPQPIVAVPAFLAVEAAAALLPGGLGFAAGAMAWLCARELVPEARVEIGTRQTAAGTLLGVVAMGILAIALD